MICPYCGNEKINKVGFKLTVKEGRKERYQCMTCARTFYKPKEA